MSSFRLLKCSGIIQYSSEKLIVSIDPEFGKYYYSLIPKHLNANHPRYPSHISVIRNEIPINKNLWNKYEGKIILFDYDPIIKYDETYIWLNAFCKELENMRVELGLLISSKYTRPPSGYQKCFHITIGNFK